MRELSICLFLLLLGGVAFSQTGIKGILIDSAHNNVLRSATVSVYQEGVKTVDKVSLTDRFGRFTVEDLPWDVPMRVEFTFYGFEKVVREFQLGRGEQQDFGRINMPMRTEDIDVVEILPPVRMVGDTIEFNADAFQLDSNAVIEDLLHKLPGIIVWGDGKITYNGQAIPNVLVNGKPFFGTDKSIALQNIAKDAVQKLQVYDRRSQTEQLTNPYDPQYEMNVVLKEGMEQMYFGNVTAGAGTDKRYEGHLNFNYANKRTQSTVAYSLNNTNKNLNSIEQLLRNTTFRGVGIHSDVNTDFLRPGIMRQQVLGARYQYDYLATKEVNRTNVIVGSVISNRYKTTDQDVSTTQLISEDSDETNMRYQSRQSDRMQQHNQGDVQYNYRGKMGQRSLMVRSQLALQQQKTEDQHVSSTRYAYVNNRSLNEIIGQDNSEEQGLTMDTRVSIGALTDPYARVRYVGMKNPYSLLERAAFDLRLKADVGGDESLMESRSNFQNILDPDLNRDVSRIYDQTGRHHLYDMGLTIRFQNLSLDHDVLYRGRHSERQVEDVNDQVDIRNDMLSHQSQWRQWIYTPSLTYVKSLYRRQLAGRMEQSIDINAKMGTRLYSEKNSSTLEFRNIEQQFTTILPDIALHQSYSRLGRYTQKSSLRYSYDEEYPELEQLRPFYDDINPAYRYFGADRLSKISKHEISGNFGYNQRKEQGYNVSFNARYTSYRNGLSDSIVQVDNQQQHYTVQIERPTYTFVLSGELDKPFLLKRERTLGIKLKWYLNWQDRPQYLNTEEQKMLTNAQNISLDVYYTWASNLAVGWISNWNRYSRRDRFSDNNQYLSTFLNSGLSMSYAITKRWTINSNASGRFMSSTFHSDRAVIWNANTAYRLGKGNNIEIKFAANDLLRQNKGIYFNNGLTEFTSGYRNNLTQYFMLSVSYFPRAFGL